MCASVSRSVVSNPIRLHGLHSPPGFSVHGILQARIPEWVVPPLGFIQAGVTEDKRGQGVKGIYKEVRLKDKISRMTVKCESRQKGQCEQKY